MDKDAIHTEMHPVGHAHRLLPENRMAIFGLLKYQLPVLAAFAST